MSRLWENFKKLQFVNWTLCSFPKPPQKYFNKILLRPRLPHIYTFLLFQEQVQVSHTHSEADFSSISHLYTTGVWHVSAVCDTSAFGEIGNSKVSQCNEANIRAPQQCGSLREAQPAPSHPQVCAIIAQRAQPSLAQSAVIPSAKQKPFYAANCQQRQYIERTTSQKSQCRSANHCLALAEHSIWYTFKQRAIPGQRTAEHRLKNHCKRERCFLSRKKVPPQLLPHINGARFRARRKETLIFQEATKTPA